MPQQKLKSNTLTIALGCLAVMLLIAGCYLASLTLAPEVLNRAPLQPITQQPIAQQDQLIIPKLNLKLPINAGTAAVLEQGMWHRYPERGNPQKGGNFILSGHRFVMGLTPWQTLNSSPLYTIDQLMIGDELYVDWAGKRYAYTVTKRYSVSPQQTSIEAPSSTAKMTLYTCTKSGAADGREVLEAKLISN